MLRGAVLTGVIRDTAGRPAPHQQVHVTLVRSPGGEKRPAPLEEPAGHATTDDRGVYRIFGLAPGDYLVSLPLALQTRQDVRRVTAAELVWADKVVAGRGRAGSPAMTEAPAAGPPLRYAPVYYPGTAVAAEASVVTLGAGEERGGVDLGLLLVPTAHVRGRVVDTENRPQSDVAVRLSPARSDTLDLFGSLPTNWDRTGSNGEFAFSSVTPGSYTLSARATPSAGAASGAQEDPAGAMLQAVGGGPAATHWASEEITVQGRNLSDVALTLRPGMILTGKIIYESATKAPPTDFSRTALGLIPAMGDDANRLASDFLGLSNVHIEADGTFSVRGIAPGRYRLNSPVVLLPPEASAFFSVMSGGWTLKSVVANGHDIADAPIEIRAGSNISGVVVTFTDQPSELTGTVLDATGRPTSGFPIVVFSTDREYWSYGSRRVQQVRPATNGRFTITGLPAGEYFVCAVPSMDRDELYDPSFLDQLIPGSFKITLQDGEKKTQDLKLAGG
jgi:protocatechuate 3,4-dioxygenase beta subunit